MESDTSSGDNRSYQSNPKTYGGTMGQTLAHVAISAGASKRRPALIQVLLSLVMLSAFIVQPAYSQSAEITSTNEVLAGGELPSISAQQAPADPMAVWNVRTVDGPRYFTNMTDRTLAYRGDGAPCAAYGGDALYYACYNSTKAAWDTVIVDNSVSVGQYASLSFFNSPVTGMSEAFISYYDAENGRLKMANTRSMAWQAPITVPTPAALLNSADSEHPVEADEPLEEEAPVLGNDIDFSSEFEKPWLPGINILEDNQPTFPITVTLGVGKFTSIAADSHGIYISYYDDREDRSVSPYVYARNLQFAHWNGVSWYFYLVDDYRDQGKVGLWSSLKVDFNSNVHIAYMDEKYDNLKYAFWNHKKHDPLDPDGAWTIVTVDGDGADQLYPNVGSMCSLAIYDPLILDVPGVPYISYLDFTDTAGGNPDGDLKLAKLNDLRSNNWNIQVLDSDGITGWWSSIVVDNSQKVYISYFDVQHLDLKYITGKLSTSWSIQRIKQMGGTQGQFTSIAINPLTARPGIISYNATNGYMEYTYLYYPPDKWATLLVDSIGHDVGFGSSLTIDNTGVPHISYFDQTRSGLKYARAFGISWSKMVALGSPNNGYSSSIAMQIDGLPRIATFDSWNQDLLFGGFNSATWGFGYVERTFDVGNYVSMAIDPTGRSHISYYDSTHQNLNYAYWNISTSKWVTDTLADVGDVGMFSSLTLSPDRRVYISYYDADNGNLMMIYQEPGMGIWVPDVVDAGVVSTDDVGQYTSIDLDGAGNPHISYYDVTNKDMKYAYWNGADWVISVVDSVGDVGRFSSLKIYTGDNTRHLCYYDYTNKDLEYARYSAGIWEFDTVDSNGDVGISCSMALTTAGEPAMSYYDNSRGDLKIALSYELPPMQLFLPTILNP